MNASDLPLAGIRVVELTHMVMGPTCGMILADLGAEVIKVEPLEGDNTRRLRGSGAGFYAMFNRNKRSLAIDLKQPEGLEALHRLLASADVFSENFKTEAMARLGLSPQALRERYPRLICVAHKGFLPGPYEERTALDEVVQMMGGLAYMTGPPGRPLRAGTSVNDIMGGMFGAIGVMAALMQRGRSGNGSTVRSALFENNVFLVAQHMMQYAVTGQPAAPMPARISAWSVYDVFDTKDGEQIFLAAVSDTQWALLCQEFQWPDLASDTRLASNNARAQERPWLLPVLRERFGAHTKAELASRFERIGLPYAPITRPQELFEDPHLQASGGLAPVEVPADASCAGQAVSTQMPLLPLTLNEARLPLRSGPPALGADTQSILASLGYSAGAIEQLHKQGVIRGTESPDHRQ
jgi:crotonobetainyl-CoA:carnitine CoA-transferase CaiB-like acyl-CoA transferase